MMNLVTFFLLLNIIHVYCDNNILTGANDILVVTGGQELKASPFSVQFGKKDIWLPRLGHPVYIHVNKEKASFTMTLDSEGRGYFTTQKVKPKKQYRFWSALLGFGEPNQKHKTNSASSSQLLSLNLQMGPNNMTYIVYPDIGKPVTVECEIFLVEDNKKIVITDIDGTITKSNVPGIILPVLGLSDWKHSGVVELYNRITQQGYLVLYLTNRAIGQSIMTRNYLYSLRENGNPLPKGPLFLQVDSVLAAFQTEVFSGGHPEMNKIAALSRLRGIFPTNPFISGFGNKPWDTLTYKAIGISDEKIYKVDEDSRVFIEGTGERTNYTELINNIDILYPKLN